MRNNRRFNRDLSVVHVMTLFLSKKGYGKTSLPMNIAPKDELGYHISKKSSGNWGVTKISMTEKQMVQIIGD